MLLIEIM